MTDSLRRALRTECDAGGWTIEQQDRYVERVGPLLPNFPPDVLLQTFYDHGTQMAEAYHWIDVTALRFEEAELSVGELTSLGLGKDELLDSLTEYILTTPDLPDRWARLSEHMTATGTWPRPIVLLDNRSGKVRAQHYEIGSPYELLEGHNRVATIRAFVQTQRRVSRRHQVWLAKIDPQRAT